MRREPTGDLPDALGADEVAVLFDAECVVCSRWVHFVLRWDHAGVIRIGAVQSEAGRALLTYAGLDPDDVDTMLVVEREVPYTKSSAGLRLLPYFGWRWQILRLGWVCPWFIRDWLYDRVAKNRYSLFGKKELCLVPSQEHRARFL